MKYIIKLILLLLLANISNAQKIRFTDTSNVWSILESSSNGPSYKEVSIDSTMKIGQYEYSVFKYGHVGIWPYSNQYDLIAVREDSMGKVYFMLDSTEYLMYDYSLDVGDTFRMIRGTDTFLHHVSSIDTVKINNVAHKAFNLHPANQAPRPYSSTRYTVIEGIGCIDGLFLPLDPVAQLVSFYLACFTNNGMTPPIVPIVNHFDNNTSCRMSIESFVEKRNILTISPHPAISGSIMTIPYTIKDGNFTLYNSFGQVAEQEVFRNTNQYVLNRYKTGVYYYTVTDNTEGTVFRGKIIFK